MKKRTTTIPPLLIIDGGPEHPFRIQPGDIDVTQHFFDAFGEMETEISAHWIVRLCQEKGGWVAFSEDDIEEYYRRASNNKFSGFGFNRLRDWKFLDDESVTKDHGFIVCGEDGLFRVTMEFIARCYHAAPKVAKPTAKAEG